MISIASNSSGSERGTDLPSSGNLGQSRRGLIGPYGAIQSDLIITDWFDPIIVVDNIEIAQFLYLLLNNQNIRHVIDTITSKVVLILGRFTPERKAILDAIRDELRKRNLDLRGRNVSRSHYRGEDHHRKHYFQFHLRPSLPARRIDAERMATTISPRAFPSRCRRHARGWCHSVIDEFANALSILLDFDVYTGLLKLSCERNRP
jgi:hypothetical protein